MTNIEQLDTKVSLLKEKAISIICACRIGGMDNNQFKATLEFNIDSLLDQAVQARNEELVELVKQIRLCENITDTYGTCYGVNPKSNKSLVDEIINLISPGRK